MNLFKFLNIIILSFIISLKVQSSDIKIGTKQSLNSQILSEKRHYWVSLPPSYKYNDYKKYPVLYLLDADFNYFFQTFTGMVNQMASDASPKIPEMIVIGVVSQQRVRDSSPTKSIIQYGGKPNKALNITGGANNFIKFLSEELIPHINQQYRTSNYTILSGYSFTGLPVLQTLFSKPETFNAYIAIDPSMWWDNQVMLKRTRTFQKGSPITNRQLYIATSQRVGKTYPKENYVIDFISMMQHTPKAGLTFISKIYGLEENHHTMPIPAFYSALSELFNGFMIDEEARFRPASKLKDHYAKLSRKLGTDLFPQEGLINYFGSDRLYNDQFTIDPELALGFYKLNTDYYPKSFHAWKNLAFAYNKIGNKEKALESFLKALDIDPSNELVLKQVKTLKEDLSISAK